MRCLLVLGWCFSFFVLVCVCPRVPVYVCIFVYAKLCTKLFSLAQSHSSVLPKNALRDSLVNSHSKVGTYWTYLINLVWHKATIIEHNTDQTDCIIKSFLGVVADYRSMVRPDAHLFWLSISQLSLRSSTHHYFLFFFYYCFFWTFKYIF